MASFLDNVVLEDFDFILEGDQAEAYKKRKAKEMRDAQKRFNNRMVRKMAVKTADMTSEEDEKRKERKANQFQSDMEKIDRHKTDDENKVYAMDALDRHRRRHHTNESTFFDDVDLV